MANVFNGDVLKVQPSSCLGLHGLLTFACTTCVYAHLYTLHAGAISDHQGGTRHSRICGKNWYMSYASFPVEITVIHDLAVHLILMGVLVYGVGGLGDPPFR